jgi:demethylmenaquinone methyltransferase/2-methoxy-6-polyprenyl-1,4-benzoquinol methylase
MIRRAGFERVVYRNLTAGIVALHRGFVPLRKADAAPSHVPEASADPKGDR